MPLIPDPAHNAELARAPILFLSATASGGETVGRVFPLWPFLDNAGDLTTRESMVAAFMAASAQFEAQAPQLQVGEADAYALRLARRRVFFVDCPDMDSSVAPQRAFANLSLTDYPGLEGPPVILGAGIDAKKAALAMLNHPDMAEFLACVDEGAAAHAALSFSSTAKSLKEKINEMRAAAALARLGTEKARQRQARKFEILTFGDLNRPAQKAPILAIHLHNAFGDADRLMIVELPLHAAGPWLDVVPRSVASAADFLAMAQLLLRGRVQKAGAGNSSAIDDLGGEAWIDQLEACCCGGRWTVHAKVKLSNVSTSTSTRGVDVLSARVQALWHALGGWPCATLGLSSRPFFERGDDQSPIPQAVQAISLIERNRSGAKLDAAYANIFFDNLAIVDTLPPVLALLDKIDLSLGIAVPPPGESAGRSRSLTL